MIILSFAGATWTLSSEVLESVFLVASIELATAFLDDLDVNHMTDCTRLS